MKKAFCLLLILAVLVGVAAGNHDAAPETNRQQAAGGNTEPERQTVERSDTADPVKITAQPKNVTQTEGEIALVTFVAAGDGLTYEWHYRDAGAIYFKKDGVFTDNTYFMVLDEAHDGRQIYCQVTDQYGNTVRTNPVTLRVATSGNRPEVIDKLSRETLNSFPVASDSMSAAELRALCIDFFRFSKTFAWTPSKDFYFIKNKIGQMDAITEGTVYGGLPYVGLGSGNVYRFMDYYDGNTGVLDISRVDKDPSVFGNQCSIGAYWGWGRVVNSAKYDWTVNMVHKKGFLRVGEYTYDDSISSFDSGLNTSEICDSNGKQTMYESYACLQPGDGLVCFNTTGHVMMCSTAPVVVRNKDGSINEEESYVLVLDQGFNWSKQFQSNGDPYMVKQNIDYRYAFSDLLFGDYLPFTFAEFLGTDPVENLECTFGHARSDITIEELQQTAVTSNYGISDLYTYIKDSRGRVVYTDVKRLKKAGVMRTMLAEDIDRRSVRRYSEGDCSVMVVGQFSNGERRVLYYGQLKG